MIVTSDSTALMLMKTAEKTGKLTRTRGEEAATLRPASRPRTTNITTGMPIVPIAPSGSRRKILISSQLNFTRPRNIVSPLIANGMPGQLEEDIFEVGELCPEVGDPDPVLGQTLDD